MKKFLTALQNAEDSYYNYLYLLRAFTVAIIMILGTILTLRSLQLLHLVKIGLVSLITALQIAEDSNYY